MRAKFCSVVTGTSQFTGHELRQDSGKTGGLQEEGMDFEEHW